MSSEKEQQSPEIILYDLACTKNECFSTSVWRVRMMLNYKRVPYTTVFVEFPDIQSTVKPLLEKQGIDTSTIRKFTVPVIHHLPSNTYMMDSVPISKFLEATYPSPPVPLTSDLGREIEFRSRRTIASVLQASVIPREIHILSPAAQDFFRRTREEQLGHPIEDLLQPGREDAAWQSISDEMKSIGELIMTNKADGPFVLGKQPSSTDFFLVGSLQCARVVDEGVFQRIVAYPGYGEVYEACQPFMIRKD